MDARPRLLDQVRNRLPTLHFSSRTGQRCLFRMRRFILFHGRRHTSDVGANEVEAFLWLDGVVRAEQSRRLPVVLTPGEVTDVLAQLGGATTG